MIIGFHMHGVITRIRVFIFVITYQESSQKQHGMIHQIMVIIFSLLTIILWRDDTPINNTKTNAVYGGIDGLYTAVKNTDTYQCLSTMYWWYKLQYIRLAAARVDAPHSV